MRLFYRRSRFISLQTAKKNGSGGIKTLYLKYLINNCDILGTYTKSKGSLCLVHVKG